MSNKVDIAIAVFLSGAIVMIYEVLGSRMLAPYLGTSLITWTALIGTILAGMSLGYWYGGKMADTKADLKVLSGILATAAVLIIFSLFVQDNLLHYLATSTFALQIKATIAALVLFAPTAVMLAMVSPYVVRLQMRGLDKAGATVGFISSLSTMGSIFGTFISGFLLIPLIGTLNLTWLLSFVLLILAWLVWPQKNKRAWAYFILVAVLWLLIGGSRIYRQSDKVVDLDTPYSRVKISDFLQKDGRKIRALQLDSQFSSAMYLDSDELVFPYSKYYSLFKYFNPQAKKALLLGGAAYSVPKEFLWHNPDKKIDVVEIDSGVTEIARKFFRLRDDDRLRIFHEDARLFLNRSPEKYDAIFGDAFANYNSLPWHLTTVESVAKQYQALNDNGVVIVNLINAIEGEKGKFLRSEYATFKKVFPQVYLFPVSDASDGQKVQNIMLVAIKSENKPKFISSNIDEETLLKNIWTKPVPNDMPILTDNYAPVDWYNSAMF